MADEDLAAAEAGQGGDDAPGADALADPNIDPNADPNADAGDAGGEAQLDPIANLASEMGWVPKEEFRGDPDEWKDAPDFIRAGKDINRSIGKQLRSMQDQLERVTRTSSQIMADKLAERDAYWADMQAKAVEDNDQAAVDRIVSKRIELRQQQPADTGPPPETRDFIERNKAWFGVDRLATLRAEEITEKLAKKGIPPAEQLADAERIVRKEFPELFKAPAKPPAATQTAQSRNATTSSRKKGFADMPAESQALARQYQKEHGVKLETFAESYWADLEKSRRVG